MKLKKLSAVLIILILIMPLSVFGANDKITVRVSGEKVIFDVEPEIIDGRTMVPVRAIFEAMGASVSWDEASGTVFAEKLGKTVEFKIGEKEADYSGKKVIMDVPAMIMGGRTLVPARYSAEGMGYKVSWDGETKTVTVSHDAELISYYKNTFVPDYGALYGVEGIETDHGVYIYDLSDISSSDPEILSIRDYTDILSELGFSYMGDEKVKEAEIKGTVYTFMKGKKAVSVGLLTTSGEDGLFITVADV